MEKYTEVFYATSVKELSFIGRNNEDGFKARVTLDVLNYMIENKDYEFKVLGTVGTTLYIVEVL